MTTPNETPWTDEEVQEMWKTCPDFAPPPGVVRRIATKAVELATGRDGHVTLEQWKDEERQKMKDQLLGPVLDTWWTEAMGELPNHRAKERLLEIADEHFNGPRTRFNPDGMTIPLSSLQRGALMDAMIDGGPDVHEAGPQTIDDEQPRPDGDDRLSGVTDEGRATGCLDPMCGDCDMK